MQYESTGKKSLRAHRLYKGWTQTELARRTGLSPTHINRLDLEQSAPSGVSLQKIARALGVDANDIDLSYAEREAA